MPETELTTIEAGKRVWKEGVFSLPVKRLVLMEDLCNIFPYVDIEDGLYKYLSLPHPTNGKWMEINLDVALEKSKLMGYADYTFNYHYDYSGFHEFGDDSLVGIKLWNHIEGTRVYKLKDLWVAVRQEWDHLCHYGEVGYEVKNDLDFRMVLED